MTTPNEKQCSKKPTESLIDLGTAGLTAEEAEHVKGGDKAPPAPKPRPRLNTYGIPGESMDSKHDSLID